MSLNILGVLDAYLESHDPTLLPILADALEEDGRVEAAAWCRHDLRIMYSKEWALRFGLRAAHYAPGWWYQEKMDGQWIGQTGGPTEADACRELARRVRERLCTDCPDCDGHGQRQIHLGDYNVEVVDCFTCAGRGWQLKPRQTTCPECKGKGSGKYWSDPDWTLEPCNRCHGTGKVEG